MAKDLRASESDADDASNDLGAPVDMADLFGLPPVHDPLTATDDDLKLVWAAPEEPTPRPAPEYEFTAESGPVVDEDRAPALDPDVLHDQFAALAGPDEPMPVLEADLSLGPAIGDDQPTPPESDPQLAFDLDRVPDREPALDLAPDLDLELTTEPALEPMPEPEPEPGSFVEPTPEPESFVEPTPELETSVVADAADTLPTPVADDADDADEIPETPAAPPSLMELATALPPERPAVEARTLLPGEVDEDDSSIERFAEAVEVPAGIDHWDEPIIRDDGTTSYSRRADEEIEAAAPRKPLPKVVFAGIVVVAAVLISLVTRTFLLQPYKSPTASMEPTIGVGETFVVNLLSYRLHDVRRGDVVVFDRPEGSAEDGAGNQLVKRVIALPGEIVESIDGVVHVDDRPLDEPYLADDMPTDGLERQTVPPGMVVVLGDNRTDSEDSRVFGPIDEDSIAGRAAVLIDLPTSFTGL